MEVAVAAFILIALLFMAWGMSIADSKCRPILLGALLGGTLGIFGIVLMWLIPANQRGIWERQQRWQRGER